MQILLDLHGPVRSNPDGLYAGFSYPVPAESFVIVTSRSLHLSVIIIVLPVGFLVFSALIKSTNRRYTSWLTSSREDGRYKINDPL